MRHSPDPTPAPPSSKILIAEDHLDSREALRALLEATGYRVAVAVDGQSALDLAIAEKPDIILMDIMMPELDGFEVMRRLRRTDTLKSVPIIAVTAMEGARQLALEAGADAVVPKPIQPPVLLRKIHALLERNTP